MPPVSPPVATFSSPAAAAANNDDDGDGGGESLSAFPSAASSVWRPPLSVVNWSHTYMPSNNRSPPPLLTLLLLPPPYSSNVNFRRSSSSPRLLPIPSSSPTPSPRPSIAHTPFTPAPAPTPVSSSSGHCLVPSCGMSFAKQSSSITCGAARSSDGGSCTRLHKMYDARGPMRRRSLLLQVGGVDEGRSNGISVGSYASIRVKRRG